MLDRTSEGTADKDRDCEEGGISPTGSYYEIKVGGHLDEHWAEWFANLSLTHDAQGNTLLVGPIADQASLYGTLAKIRDLGLALISLTPL